MSKNKPWPFLKYWNSGECQVIEERLRDLTLKKIAWCPGKTNLFRSLSLCPFDSVRCVLVGQDPYPDPKFATGVAFSIPPTEKTIPPTLAMMVKELQTDLPSFTIENGDLTPWCAQGVLLWNVIPSCTGWISKSHHWPEYEYLTKEIFELLSPKGVVFAFLGSTAREYEKYVQVPSVSLHTSHPSPRGHIHAQSPFLGSRLFSTININLVKLGKEPIEWRLPCPTADAARKVHPKRLHKNQDHTPSAMVH